MSALTDIVCTVVDLVQSVVKYETKSLLLKIDEQAKAMECCFRRIYIWCGFLAMIMLVLLSGIGLIIAGFYMLLASAIGSGTAALIVGVIVSLLAAVLIVTIKSSKE
jgi:VIT1/CCC1 family predicted Fe2+/Mn2+ transporter